MRTTRGPRGTFFHYNADGSGGVQITHPTNGNSLTVPAEDVIHFVAETVREARVAEIENECGLCLIGAPHSHPGDEA